MLVSVVLALAGLALLTVAADQLVIGAGRLAVRLRIAPVVVGVVVIGLGTSTPEFLVSGLAAGHGNSGLAIGNIAGSNILNLTLILGVAALIAPVRVGSSVLRREAPLTVAAVGVFAAATRVGLGRATGLVLAVAMIAVLVLLVRLAAHEAAPLSGEVTAYLDGRRYSLAGESLRAIVGLTAVLAGAQLLVVNAGHLATRLGVSDTVIGFTLVALGTSLPELVTAIQAQRHGEPDLVVGNLLGSDLFNSLTGGAVIGLASAHQAAAGVSGWVLVAMVAVAALAWLLLYRGHRITRPEAILLLLVYLAVLPLLR